MVAWDALLGRLKFLRQAGITFGGKRDTYEILGYARVLTAYDYVDRYARGDLAGRIVELFPNATWRGGMFLAEREDDADPTPSTEFEKAWVNLDRRLQVQATLRILDILGQLSTYSCLLIGVKDDNGDLSQPLPKGKGPEDLMYLKPLLGAGGPAGSDANRNRPDKTLDVADISILEFETNPLDPRFGQAKTYQIRRPNLTSPILSRPVHWTRIVHFADNALFDDVYGTPRLERVWNRLDDLDKVMGGGAEAFWLRANQGFHMNVDKDMSFPPTKPGEKSELDKVSEQAEAYAHQLTRFIRTRGVDVNPLGSDVANFNDPADAIITVIAGALGVPKRILTGSEMGELASSQDRENWRDQINGRQTQVAAPRIVRALANRLVENGYLPKPTKGPDEYYVVWAHIQTLTENEKFQGAEAWAGTYTYDGTPVFTPDEIRQKWYGMEPLPEPTPEELAARGIPTPEELAAQAEGATARAAAGAEDTHVEDFVERAVLRSGRAALRSFVADYTGSGRSHVAIAAAVKRAENRMRDLEQPLTKTFLAAFEEADNAIEDMRAASQGHDA